MGSGEEGRQVIYEMKEVQVSSPGGRGDVMIN